MNKLAIKIQARNRLNQAIRDNVPLIVAALQPFLGKVITKADGTLLNRVNGVLPQMNKVRLNWLYSVSYGSLKVHFKVAEVVEDHCVYQEETYYLADVGSHNEIAKIKSVNPIYYRTDFNEIDIVLDRSRVKELENELSNVKNKLNNFGMFDA